MAVVINEVEVTPAERKVESTEEKGGGEQAHASQHELRRLLEQEASRCERVWAY